MGDRSLSTTVRLSIVIPCYNEARTLERCVARVLAIAEDGLALELIIVDDGSQDESHTIAQNLAAAHPEIEVRRHENNMGKGAALRTGFSMARGDFVAVQDTDLDPQELKARRLFPFCLSSGLSVCRSCFSPWAVRLLPPYLVV